MGANTSNLKPKQARMVRFEPTLHGTIAHGAVHSVGASHPGAGQPAVMTGKWEFRGEEVDTTNEVKLAVGSFGRRAAAPVPPRFPA